MLPQKFYVAVDFDLRDHSPSPPPKVAKPVEDPLYSDSELSDGDYDHNDLELENMNILKDILKVDQPPALAYIPTDKVMKQLILRHLK